MGTLRRGEAVPSPARVRFAPVRVHPVDPYAGIDAWFERVGPMIQSALAFGLSRSDVLDVFMRAIDSARGEDPLDWVADELADCIQRQRADA